MKTARNIFKIILGTLALIFCLGGKANQHDISEIIEFERILEEDVEPRHRHIVRAWGREFSTHLDKVVLPITTETLQQMCREVVESPTCRDFPRENLLQCDSIEDEDAAPLRNAVMEMLSNAASSIGELRHLRDREVREAVMAYLREDYDRVLGQRSELYPDTPVRNHLLALGVASGEIISSVIESTADVVGQTFYAATHGHCFNTSYLAATTVGFGVEMAALTPVGRVATTGRTASRLTGAAVAARRTVTSACGNQARNCREIYGQAFRIRRPINRKNARDAILGGNISPREVSRTIERLGWGFQQNGTSHRVFTMEGMPSNVSVPMHGSVVKNGTMKSILDKMEITAEDFYYAWRGNQIN